MKIHQLCIAAVACLFLLDSHLSADIVASTMEPTTNILLDEYHNNAGSLAGTNITDGTSARGTFFSLDTLTLTGGAAAQGSSNIGPNINARIDALTFQINGAAGVSATGLDILFFRGNPADDATGGVNLAGFLTDTGIAPILSENHVLPATFGSANFFTINLDNPFIVDSSEDIGVFIFANGGAITQIEGQNSGGGRLNFNTSGFQGASGVRDFNFLIHGVAIPEPTSLALLGLGALGLIARRRRS